MEYCLGIATNGSSAPKKCQTMLLVRISREGWAAREPGDGHGARLEGGEASVFVVYLQEENHSPECEKEHNLGNATDLDGPQR
jgi:hypothetical protein